jgi:hypothetical protein
MEEIVNILYNFYKVTILRLCKKIFSNPPVFSQNNNLKKAIIKHLIEQKTMILLICIK